MTAHLEAGNGASVLCLSESVTIGDAAELKRLLLEALRAGQQVAVDLSGVTEVDISAIQLFLAARQAAERAGLDFGARGEPAEPVERAFQDCGLHPFAGGPN